jgi:dTDP-4-amino-4,6-dideoxygalactose transaminase
VIPIALPYLDDDEGNAAREVMLSGWVSQGPKVAAFERDFAAFVGAPHASAVCNCTAALHLALQVLGIAPGDEVITASHSFIATANCIRHCGASPVFVDIDPETCNIDPGCVADAITAFAALSTNQLGTRQTFLPSEKLGV